MKAIFVHDHIFKTYESYVYSDKLPYEIWKRYLKHFNTLTIFAREQKLKSNILNQPLSSGNNVCFEFGPSISSLKSIFKERKIQKERLKNLILKHDVIIARLPSEYGLISVEIAQSLNKKIVIEVVGCPWDSLWNYGNFKAKIYAPIQTYKMRRVINKSDFVVYVSQNYLQKRYPASLNASTIGISNVEIPIVSDNVIEKRLEKISKKNKKIVLGLIGSFKTKYKGIHNIIPVLSRLVVKYPDIELRILGSGDIDKYKKIAKKFNVVEKVFFDGVLPSGEKVFDWLDKIDIYIQPSLTEGVPRALIEAMSRGCPSIASTAGGIPELLDKNLTFNPSDKNKFYEVLEKNIFSIEWRIKQAKKNFEKSKDYQKDILDNKRYEFFEKVKESK